MIATPNTKMTRTNSTHSIVCGSPRLRRVANHGQPDDGTNFLGVELDQVLEVGKLAVVAGKLEWTVQQAAFSFGLSYEGKSLKRVVKDIRARAADGPEDWPDGLSASLGSWCERAITAIDLRDRWVHAVMVRLHVGGEQFIRASMHLKSGESEAVERRLAAAIDLLVDVMNECSRLHFQLMQHQRS